MLTVHSISNKCCSDAAVTSEALADRSESAVGGFTAGNAVEFPASGTVSDPSLFAISGSNPNSGFASPVSNEQSPFGFEFENVAVSNGLLTERVDDHNDFALQNEFWSNPEQGCCGGNACCNGEIQQDNLAITWVEERLNGKQADKGQSNQTPNEVASRSENSDIIHASIIAGSAAVQEGK